MTTEEFAKRVVAEAVWGNQSLHGEIDLVCLAEVSGYMVALRRAALGSFAVHRFRIYLNCAYGVELALNSYSSSYSSEYFYGTLEAAMAEYMAVISGKAL